ncbi:hypothetical protein niasHS_009883 [Heterodera schachtii]|uniref:Nuclear receptor domain-containing protein n=1 Tax=Heterodera schachtii TaxID=97005 RepID=A0ABD2JD41_HETSC
MNSISENNSSSCSVCGQKCKYVYYGVKCCEGCKHFFRRSISMMKEYNCDNGGECDIEKYKTCKLCRLNKCLTVGMNPRGVSATKFSGQQILAFVQQMKQQVASLAAASSSNLTGFELSTQTNTTAKNGPQQWDSLNSVLEQKDYVGFVMLKNLLNIEQKVRRIRYSPTPIPELFYEQCDSFESIFARKINLIELAHKFSTKLLQPFPPIFFEKVRQFGPFFFRPEDMVMNLLCVFEIGKTFSFFEQLDPNDKIALCSNIAMPLYVLCNGFYSVQQNCDVFCTPNGLMLITTFANSYFNQDSVAMRMGDKLLCKAMEPFINYGPPAGALRYVELMGLIECLFIAGVKNRQLLTYISNVLTKDFDRVFPPVLAKICTKGPVESHQLFPY